MTTNGPQKPSYNIFQLTNVIRFALAWIDFKAPKTENYIIFKSSAKPALFEHFQQNILPLLDSPLEEKTVNAMVARYRDGQKNDEPLRSKTESPRHIQQKVIHPKFIHPKEGLGTQFEAENGLSTLSIQEANVFWAAMLKHVMQHSGILDDDDCVDIYNELVNSLRKISSNKDQIGYKDNYQAIFRALTLQLYSIGKSMQANAIHNIFYIAQLCDRNKETNGMTIEGIAPVFAVVFLEGLNLDGRIVSFRPSKTFRSKGRLSDKDEKKKSKAMRDEYKFMQSVLESVMQDVLYRDFASLTTPKFEGFRNSDTLPKSIFPFTRRSSNPKKLTLSSSQPLTLSYNQTLEKSIPSNMAVRSTSCTLIADDGSIEAPGGEEECITSPSRLRQNNHTP